MFRRGDDTVGASELVEIMCQDQPDGRCLIKVEFS
jgi:hypothetical protein